MYVTKQHYSVIVLIYVYIMMIVFLLTLDIVCY